MHGEIQFNWMRELRFCPHKVKEAHAPQHTIGLTSVLLLSATFDEKMIITTKILVRTENDSIQLDISLHRAGLSCKCEQMLFQIELGVGMV